MFGVTKQKLVAGLRGLGGRVCGYGNPARCDCKFGPGDGPEQTGRPEAAMAAALVEAMTPDEFRRICKRAKVRVFSEAGW